MIQPGIIDTAPQFRAAAKAVIAEAIEIGEKGTRGDGTESGLFREILTALGWSAGLKVGGTEYAVKVGPPDDREIVYAGLLGACEEMVEVHPHWVAPQIVTRTVLRTDWTEATL